jgi:hypothetical protein
MKANGQLDISEEAFQALRDEPEMAEVFDDEEPQVEQLETVEPMDEVQIDKNLFDYLLIH